MITSINIKNVVLHAQFIGMCKQRHFSFSDFVQICEMYYLTNKNGIFQKMFDFESVLEMLDFLKLSDKGVKNENCDCNY